MPNCPAPVPKCSGPDLPRWQRLAGAVRRNYWGGDCYAHGLLALGQIDVIAECDHEALGLGGAGAGGRGRRRQGHRLAGKALRPDGDGRVLAVGDPALLPQAVAC